MMCKNDEHISSLQGTKTPKFILDKIMNPHHTYRVK